MNPAVMAPLADWPLTERRGIRGVFTDIDDTLTTHGDITADALDALAALRAAGLTVIAITGRPVGWSEPKARAWPVDAIVAENGAVALISDKNGPIHRRKVLVRYQKYTNWMPPPAWPTRSACARAAARVAA